MKEIITQVYTFDELSDEAKEMARDWYRVGALDYEWYESTYDDAAKIGLKITGFDLGRGQYVEGEIRTSAPEVAEAIIAEHGPKTDTYLLAKRYLTDLKRVGDSCDDEAKRDAWETEREEIDTEFKRDLLEEYRLILDKEYEYQLSDESVDEMIQANEYTFTAEGKRFG